MKKIFILLCLLQTAVYAQNPCPSYGSAKPGTLKYVMNQKKNRTDVPTSYKPITMKEWMALPEDSSDDGKAYQLKGGFVLKVKKMGPESCNCKSKTDLDYHIVVIPAPEDAGNVSKYVIVEVTPRVSKLKNWQGEEIKKLENHYVDFYGRKFADVEHKNMSTKSNKDCKDCWRGTVNEIHPVLKWVVKP
jgi:hypothetical protein